MKTFCVVCIGLKYTYYKSALFISTLFTLVKFVKTTQRRPTKIREVGGMRWRRAFGNSAENLAVDGIHPRRCPRAIFTLDDYIINKPAVTAEFIFYFFFTYFVYICVRQHHSTERLLPLCILAVYFAVIIFIFAHYSIILYFSDDADSSYPIFSVYK